MTLQQLEYFLSCATLLNFRKAARFQYTSAPTLTRQIALLEEELGVRLFVRNSHSVALTEEGLWFFQTAYGMVTALQDFRGTLAEKGRLPEERNPVFRVGSYAFDSMYGLLVDKLLAAPDFFLGKPVRVDFIQAGRMAEHVLDGEVQLGVDTAAMLEPYGEAFSARLLCRSPFRLLCGNAHPLASRKSIPPDELLRDYGSLANFLPADELHADERERRLESVRELKELGERTIEHLPRLMPAFADAQRAGGGPLLLFTRALCLPDMRALHSVDIQGDPITADYVLFWRRDNQNPDIPKFLEILG